MAPVLFVSYAGVLGGSERVLLQWAPAAGERAVLACPEGPLARAARARGIVVLELRERPLARRTGGEGGGGDRTAVRAGAALGAHAFEIRRLVGSLAPELVVAWGMRSALACAAAGVRFAFSHHDLLPGGAVGAAVRAAARRATAVAVPSRAVAADLGAVGVPVSVVAPGIDAARFAAIGPPPAGPPEVLVLGALTAWKRPDLALEIVAAARREVAGLRLRIVGGPVTAGDRAYVAALARRAAEPDLAGAVALCGPTDDVAGELARATCLLHCAPHEPFGLVVLEAMASGRPVVVPTAAGPAEIADPRCAILYPPGDVAAAARALAEIVHEPAQAIAIGAAGRRRAVARFGVGESRRRFGEALGLGASADAGARASAAAGTGAGAGTDAGAGAGTGAGTGAETDAGAGLLTLVIVAHDSAVELAVLLGSAARRLPGVPVVVVDSGSSDDSVSVACSHPGATVIELGENAGFGRACNRGLAEVATPAAAFVNPDVELLDDSLLALAREALRADRPPRLLAPRVLEPDGAIQDTVHPRPGSAADLVRSVLPPALVGGAPGRALAPWRSATPRRVGWAVGCALVAPAATLRALGPFDESIFLYGEDLELGLRAGREGIETWLWPAALVVHHRAHASRRAFGGEPFARLARARHDAVARGLGPGWARLDDGAQAATFATRIALRRAVGRPAARERRQLAAVRELRRANRP